MTAGYGDSARIDVREKMPADHGAVHKLHQDAFPTLAEANLVERLRADGDAVISLVAVRAGDIVGHAMLSRMQAPFKALGLAPVAVAAPHRRKGIGFRLIATALERAAREGWEAVFVLGDPEYYQRFGFAAATAARFDSPYARPAFMALALTPAGLPIRSGRVDYAPAFADLE